jgi:hypothetical protein
MVNDCLSAANFAGLFLPVQPILPVYPARVFELSH